MHIFKSTFILTACICMVSAPAWAAHPKKRMETRAMTTTHHYSNASKEVPSSVSDAPLSVPSPARVVVSKGGTTQTFVPAAPSSVAQKSPPVLSRTGNGPDTAEPKTPHKPAVTVIVNPITGESRTQ